MNMTKAMTETKMMLTDIKDSIAFADKICSQCNLCWRTPNDPELFCWPKFMLDRMSFIEEFILKLITDRQKGKDVNKYRHKKTWREIFCHTKKGVCTQRGKCNKRKKKKCYRLFNDQILALDLEGSPIQQPKAKKGKKNKGQKGKKVHPANDDTWWQDEAYGYGGNHNYSKDQPEVTVIGKKKFQNKVDKILDEDTDQ